MSERLQALNNLWLNKAYASSVDLQKGKIERLIDLLTLHNSILYKRFILGLDQIMDTFLHNGNDECF